MYRRLLNSCLFISFILVATFTTAQTEGVSFIAFDHGHYSFDFSNLTKIKWQHERHYQVNVLTEADVIRLRNVLIETSQIKEEVLVEVNVKVMSGNRADTTYQLSAFKPQPFDAEIMDHLLIINDLAVGDTIDVTYTIQSQPSTQIQRWTLQYDYPVKESSVTYLLPKVFTYNTVITDKVYFTDQTTLDSTLRLAKGKIDLVGVRNEFKNIPAFREEPYAPQPIESRPACLFTLSDFSLGENSAYLPNWPEQLIDLAISDVFGKQYRIRSNYKWLINEAGDLFDKKYEDKLLVLKLYQFIHDKFTWDGSYDLIPSLSLLEMQYEKTVNKAAMNMALLALLTEAGFKANPVLVTTSDQPTVSKEIDDVNQFNHFVLEVILSSREVVYLDAGEPSLPIGWIDSGLRRDPVVRIQNLRGHWSSLPAFAGASMMVVNMKIKDDFSATGSMHISFTGYDAFSERLMLKNDRQAQYWKTRAASLSPNIRVDSVRFQNVTNLMEPFENTVYFHMEGSADSDELQVNPIFYSFFSGEYFTDTLRQNAVELPFAIVEQCVLNIDLPQSMEGTYSDPVKLTLEQSNASIEFNASQTNQKLRSTFKANLPTTQFRAVHYPGLKIFFDNARSLTQKAIIFRKK